MRYLSEDGKVFNNEDDCIKHEIETKKEKESEQKKLEERKKKKEEINKAWDNYIRLLMEYEKDYGALDVNSIKDIWNYLYNLI